MKKSFICVLSLLLAVNNSANATQKNITVVETRKIIESSMAHGDIISQVQKKNEEFREAIQKDESLLKDKYKDLETKRNALSKEALDKKNEEISKEVAELQKKSYAQHSALEEAYRNATQNLIDKTSDIVKKHSQKNGYQIVVEKGAVVYSDEGLDITDVVLEELNKEMPKFKVEFPQDEVNEDKKPDGKKK